MSDTTTANYGWIKPAVGASTSTWGGKLNADFDGIDAQVFAANTTANSAQTNAANAASAAAAAQTTANQALNLAQNPPAPTGFLPLSGGTMTGVLNVNAGVARSITVTGGMSLTQAALIPYITMNKAVSNANVIAGTTAGNANRWALILGDTSSESGGNNGSNFVVSRFNDSGGGMDNPFEIVRSTGGIFVTQAITVSSDAGMKKNIDTIGDALALVARMRGVRFDPINGGEREVGLVAQEVQPVLPEVVRQDENRMLGVKYSALVAVLVEAVKELAARVEVLEAR